MALKNLTEPAVFDRGFARRLQTFKEGLLPYLKGRIQLLEESPSGRELSPEPDAPRGYTHGDDVRYIDWNLYARLDKLYLKTMTREEEAPAVLLLDSSESMWTPDSGKFTGVLKAAATLADLFLSLGHRVLIVPWSEGVQGTYGPYMGENELQSVLEVLSSLRTGGASDLRKSLREAAPSNGAHLAYPIVLSDFLFPLDYDREVAYLASGPLSMGALQILSPEETAGGLRGNLILTDPETNREETLHIGYRTSRIFQEAFRTHTENVEDTFRRNGAVFHRTSSTDTFESAVKGLLG